MSTFIEHVCLPYLKRGQNHDGGWGFMPASGQPCGTNGLGSSGAAGNQRSGGVGPDYFAGHGFFEADATGGWIVAGGPGTKRRIVGDLASLLGAAIQQETAAEPRSRRGLAGQRVAGRIEAIDEIHAGFWRGEAGGAG